MQKGPRVEQIEIALENLGQTMNGEADTVVGHPALRKIICTYFLAAVSRSHLGTTLVRQLLLLLIEHLLVKARSQDLHVKFLDYDWSLNGI